MNKAVTLEQNLELEHLRVMFQKEEHQKAFLKECKKQWVELPKYSTQNHDVIFKEGVVLQYEYVGMEHWYVYTIGNNVLILGTNKNSIIPLSMHEYSQLFNNNVQTGS